MSDKKRDSGAVTRGRTRLFNCCSAANHWKERRVAVASVWVAQTTKITGAAFAAWLAVKREEKEQKDRV
ncbi:hypothetical protein HanRHA438_Chr11g0499571 [Helianthus annuus]|uniref:Uncharacterized protein n=1 Tax=Helianthus annuus TaxID=4232 RepID=A0A9K3MZR7_HELAN|nr:hypothetical protein HanXRQr2_Chr11g0486821 [Helianthus annuus]KAJ0870364.1 hypothetical protein HanRHA438_Chr11g0499571 [Helianthus annuus]KAJ0874838.1 hypothetical protein HanPSC8_Chr11g0469011 [Helianthus annuus]